MFFPSSYHACLPLSIDPPVNSQFHHGGDFVPAFRHFRFLESEGPVELSGGLVFRRIGEPATLRPAAGEGAGAVSVAAAMFDKFNLKGKRVVSIVSGGNIDVTSLSRVIDRGLRKSGRSSSMLIELIDKPGQLKDISRIIADCGGNVTGVHYEKGETESINGCFLRIEMETRDYDHVNLIMNSLRNEGFKIIR